ncbi:D-alanyl-D-alanine carboxypeptidase/D-alanyl-D-alanine-endopeptidase [Luteibacter sp. Sphag1AF]|uniref:D-alanyl-D-alanine carboxypeptidase/D-alanyl-D-alanine endopeptidase n=1 Tax=Luteibacter sp. Sphag1AF TaxID=2587031 RepID=UPI0016218E91|nr:D-alanyl-D-alanine carboxypeptidase/D-alanyl-D-alanine-endopeptidase [Luteibacter sp. Sphag1AF]
MRHALACLALLVAAPAWAQDTLAERIDARITQPRFASASWGVAVMSLDDGRMIYSHDAGRLMLPASVAKLFTAAHALDTLGPAATLQTSLLASGAANGHALNGSLVLRGGGDPSLGAAESSRDWAQRLTAALVQQGITRVEGDLIADDTAFAGPAFGSGWEANDLQAYFAAPAASLNVDENVADVSIQPAEQAGTPAALAMMSADSGLSLEGAIETSARGSASDLNVYRAPGSTRLQAFGSLPAGSPAIRLHVSLADPARVAAMKLRSAMLAGGVTLTGQIRVVHWPETLPETLTAQLRPLANVTSPTMAELLRTGLKRSQNLYMQSIWLTTGLHAPVGDLTTFTSTETRAANTVADWLGNLGVGPTAARQEEGTGLSRRDLTTASALIRVLQHMDGQPSAEVFRDALPVAGVDGTLKNRMRGTAAEGNLRAKTGSMALVSSLAGYVTTKGGQRLAFAIMLNQYQPADGQGVPSAAADVDAVAVMLAEAVRTL